MIRAHLKKCIAPHKATAMEPETAFVSSAELSSSIGDAAPSISDISAFPRCNRSVKAL